MLLRACRPMCELQKVILHQAGLRVVNSCNEWSDRFVSRTLCVSSVSDLHCYLQLTPSAGDRCVLAYS
jgi:hypothetical protein